MHEDGQTLGNSVSNAMYMTPSGSFDDWRLIAVPGLRPPAGTNSQKFSV